jgi:hypothetical protein
MSIRKFAEQDSYRIGQIKAKEEMEWNNRWSKDFYV